MYKHTEINKSILGIISQFQFVVINNTIKMMLNIPAIPATKLLIFIRATKNAMNVKIQIILTNIIFFLSKIILVLLKNI